jgi:MerR family mercuric resistance operon transcriptional regulator
VCLQRRCATTSRSVCSLAPSRTSSGYRSYDADVLPRLKFIRATQAVGLSLTDIHEILRIRDSGSAPCRHVVSLLEQRRAEVAARVREPRQLERDLAELGTAGKAWTRLSATHPASAASFPQRAIQCLNMRGSIGLSLGRG